MFTNPTPRQIAAYTALTTSGFIFLMVVLFNSFTGGLTEALSLTLLPLLSFIFCYLVVKFSIENFIYRRVKIIYKKITDYKKPSNGEDSEEIPELLSDVEQKVDEWKADQNKEINTLRDLEKYRRDYLGNVSHELKTPIFNIQGFLHTLIAGGLADPTINMAYLQKAAKNVDRLQTIVEDLETISRLESGQMILDIQTFDIQKLTQEVVEELEMKAKQKNIKLGLKEKSGMSYLVKADRESIRHVLMNLINNSIKYGKANGTTKVGFYDMHNIVLVEVTDNGIGIGKGHLKHVFDRFYRVDVSRSRDAGGSGIGLSIVKHIVEAHQQTVHLRSSEGVGSTFGFTLEKSKVVSPKS